MTDVVAVGLITAGSSLVAAAIGAVATYKVSSRGADAAIATAESQNEIELARIEAENTRLVAQHAEDERRNRRDMYHRALSTLQSIYALTGPDDENFSQVTAEWRNWRAGINIFGSPPASEAIEEVQAVLLRFPDEHGQEGWENDLGQAIQEFVSAVREDLSVDITAPQGSV